MVIYEISLKKIENFRSQTKFKIRVDESLNLNSHQVVYYNPCNKTTRKTYKRRTVNLDSKIKEQVLEELGTLHEIIADYEKKLH